MTFSKSEGQMKLEVGPPGADLMIFDLVFSLAVYSYFFILRLINAFHWSQVFLLFLFSHDLYIIAGKSHQDDLSWKTKKTKLRSRDKYVYLFTSKNTCSHITACDYNGTVDVKVSVNFRIFSIVLTHFLAVSYYRNMDYVRALIPIITRMLQELCHLFMR